MSGGSRSRRVDSTWPNLTKIGTELLERQAQAHGARAREVAPEQRARVDERPQAAHALVAEQEFVEPVPERDADDAGEAQERIRRL